MAYNLFMSYFIAYYVIGNREQIVNQQQVAKWLYIRLTQAGSLDICCSSGQIKENNINIFSKSHFFWTGCYCILFTM